MEVPINKDIREYKQSIFFGLDLRQLLWSGAAILAGVGIFVVVNKYMVEEIALILSAAVAIPFMMMAFYKRNNMPMEEVIEVWIRSQRTPRELSFVEINEYAQRMMEHKEQKEKEAKQSATKYNKRSAKSRQKASVREESGDGQ